MHSTRRQSCGWGGKPMYDHEFPALSMYQSWCLHCSAFSFFYPNNRSNPQRVPNLTSTAYSVPNNSSANRKAAKIKKIHVHVPFDVRYTYISVKCSIILRYVVVWFVQKKKVHSVRKYFRVFKITLLRQIVDNISKQLPSTTLGIVLVDEIRCCPFMTFHK